MRELNPQTFEWHLYIMEYTTTIYPVQMNSTLQCTVMVNDFALTSQWLPVDCGRIFSKMVFICESTISDIRTKNSLKDLLLYNYICPRNYITLKVGANSSVSR